MEIGDSIHKFHPNFKSVHPAIANEFDFFRIHFSHHCGFSAMVKKTTPLEMNNWKSEELQSFRINLRNIDRLYHTSDSLYLNTDMWEYIIRIQPDDGGNPIYIQVMAERRYCMSNGENGKIKGGGFIYLSRDASMFMNVVLRSDINKIPIYQSLREDGIQYEDQTEFDDEKGNSRKRVPSLVFICHEFFNENRYQLQSQTPQIPHIMIKSLNDFIHLRDAKEVYRKITWPVVDWPFFDN